MSKLKVRNLELGKGKPKVCVPLVAKNFEELFSEALRISQLDCDVIEWRADYFMYAHDERFMKKAAYFVRYAIDDKPLIFTYRTLQEGGGQHIGLDDYIKLNRMMMDTGLVDVVDLELEMVLEKPSDIMVHAKEKNVKVLLSKHNHLLTPEKNQMYETIKDMYQLGGDISKLSVTPNSQQDVLNVLEISNKVKENHPEIPFVLISMGEMGQLSRMTGELYGSVLTYASNGKYLSAPGQLPISVVREGMEVIGYKRGSK
ncbi:MULTISPECIES: type I 3-dehydroquinate dehydratase [Vagococcus]|uniref:type I 3-dehydroquinate dehydratase n=1 Tax=Vagococcus TaxID=2737 RepID=UPI000E51E1DB|nr:MULTISPECIES: type I 3-dehydroquinate dehydratase [Vagococcus]RHH71239.1 type I 3-dehydroquinate dehydratase [Vagococcus sp. AM17-17]